MPYNKKFEAWYISIGFAGIDAEKVDAEDIKNIAALAYKKGAQNEANYVVTNALQNKGE